MRVQRRRRAAYSAVMTRLMSDVYWALGTARYPSYEAFVAAASAYQEEIAPGRHGWNPDQVLATGPMTLVYEAGWKDEDDLLEVVVGEPGQPVTMGRVLYELNQQGFEFFEGADHHFFEGLTLEEDGVHQISIGS
jgi:hypothetical protein